MHLAWGYFRDLYQDLLDPDDVHDRRRYLDGRRAAVADHLAELEPLRRREPRRLPPDEDRRSRLEKLYALSRTSDYLLELSCPAGDPPAGSVDSGGVAGRRGYERRLEPAELALHTDFLTGIGLVPFTHAGEFSPFHHEIFAVVRDDAATAVTIEDVLWPGFWFGDLLFSRAGVRVRAPRALIDARVATTSTLYFTFRRQPRPVDDLSHGWGSNSQWRTAFPRFYDDEGGLHLNWDGEADLAGEPVPDGYPVDQRRELLLYRCFVRTDLPGDEGDRFPYRDRLTLTGRQG